ncbi:hypothetical protein TPA0906_73220 [Streptomyces olivaceus]|nr:hypothetical protein TPA0906_73220 [Streptomyces olivaceus]
MSPFALCDVRGDCPGSSNSFAQEAFRNTDVMTAGVLSSSPGQWRAAPARGPGPRPRDEAQSGRTAVRNREAQARARRKRQEAARRRAGTGVVKILAELTVRRHWGSGPFTGGSDL